MRARLSPVRKNGTFAGALLSLDNRPEADPAHLAERLTRLARVAAELQSTDDIKRLTEIIISHLADAAGATSASLSVVRRGRSRLAMLGLRGGSADAGSRWATYPAQGTPAGEVLQGREPLFFADRTQLACRASPTLADDMAEPGSTLVLPLLVGSRGVGVVVAVLPELPPDRLRRARLLPDDGRRLRPGARAHPCPRQGRGAEREAALPRRGQRRAHPQPRLRADPRPGRRAGRAGLRRLVRDLAGAGRRAAHPGRRPPRSRRRSSVALDLQQRYPADPDAPGGAYEVLRTGEPLLVAEIPEELLAASAQNDEHLELLRELELRSGLTVALKARGRTFGTVTWVNGEGGRRFDQQRRVLRRGPRPPGGRRHRQRPAAQRAAPDRRQPAAGGGAARAAGPRPLGPHRGVLLGGAGRRRRRLLRRRSRCPTAGSPSWSAT